MSCPARALQLARTRCANRDARQHRRARWGDACAFRPRQQRVCQLVCFAAEEESTYSPWEAPGVRVEDDLDALLEILPSDVRSPLLTHSNRNNLIEVVLDLGRAPQARFRDGSERIADRRISREDLAFASRNVGEFGTDNRAGIEGTLHRISAIRTRAGAIVGLTCRVGRAVEGHVNMIRDLLETPQSILFLGKPGIGKTTVIRELARILADEAGKRVVIVDTSNEIGGDGDVPHPAVGSARRMQVPAVHQQHSIMIEAVENHMPEVIIVDEVGTKEEALACRTIAERGVTLIATAHGQVLSNIMNNPMLSDLVGGLTSVTLGDDTARERNCQKSILERKHPSTFPVLIEMRERSLWVEHSVEESVDELLRGNLPYVQLRHRDAETHDVKILRSVYTEEAINLEAEGAARSSRDVGLVSRSPVTESAELDDAPSTVDPVLMASSEAATAAALATSSDAQFTEFARKLASMDDHRVLEALSQSIDSDKPARGSLTHAQRKRAGRKARAKLQSQLRQFKKL